MTIAPRESASPLLRYDYILLGAVFFFSALGLIMVMSASGVVAEKVYGDKYTLFWKQTMYMLVGFLILLAAARIPVRYFQQRPYFWILLAAGLLILTLIPPFSNTVGGASRWLRLGPLSIQPLELTKVALIFYLAYFFANKQDLIQTFSVGFLPPILVTAGLCVLLLLQPDFGGAVVLATLLFLICLVGGTRIIFLASGVMLAAVSAVLLVMHSPYRFRRFFAFLDPFQDAQDSGYQLVQSLYGLGSGGWLGLGLGEGRQKLFFLPEAHNDFIMSVLGEELGFIGLSLAIILFGVILWRVILISVRQQDLQDRITAFGMGAVILVSVVLNIGVVLGAFPPKGVPMPFLSYGGSHLLAEYFCVGMLLNLSRKARP